MKQKKIIKKELIKKGFTLQHESDEVLQFTGIGFLDVLLANQKLLTIPKINLLEIKKYADLFGEWSVIEKLQGAKRSAPWKSIFNFLDSIGNYLNRQRNGLTR